MVSIKFENEGEAAASPFYFFLCLFFGVVI